MRKELAAISSRGSLVMRTCGIFADELRSNDPNVGKLMETIGNEMLAKYGLQTLDLLMQSKIPPTWKDQLAQLFVMDPPRTMRSAIVFRLLLAAQGAGSQMQCVRIHSGDALEKDREKPVRVELRVGGDVVESKWILEHGQWHLHDYAFS